MGSDGYDVLILTDTMPFELGRDPASNDLLVSCVQRRRIPIVFELRCYDLKVHLNRINYKFQALLQASFDWLNFDLMYSAWMSKQCLNRPIPSSSSVEKSSLEQQVAFKVILHPEEPPWSWFAAVDAERYDEC